MPFGDPRTAIVIDQADGFEQLTRAKFNRSCQSGRRHIRGDDERQVLRGRREGRNRLGLDERGSQLNETIQVDLDDPDGPRKIGFERQIGPELPSKSDVLTVDEQLGGSPGMQGLVASLNNLQLGTHRPGGHPCGLKRIGDPGHNSALARLLRGAIAEHECREQSRLWRNCSLQFGQFGSTRLDRPRRNARGAVAGTGLRTEDRAGFEQRQVGQTARKIAVRHLGQSGQQRGAQETGARIECIRELDLADGLAGGRAEQLVGVLVKERVGDRFGESVRGERVRNLPTQPLGAGQSATGRCDREDRGDVSVALNTCDLFGKRPLIGEVWAPAWRRDQESLATVADGAANFAQRLTDLLGFVVHADNPAGELGWQLDNVALGGCGDRRPKVVANSPGKVDQQLRHPFGGDRAERRVDTAFEAFRRFAGQLVSAS